MSADAVRQFIEIGFENANIVSRLVADHAQRIAKVHGKLYGERAAKWPAAMSKSLSGGASADGWQSAWQSYALDSWQRGLILLDVLRQRGNAFNEHEASGMPPCWTSPMSRSSTAAPSPARSTTRSS